MVKVILEIWINGKKCQKVETEPLWFKTNGIIFTCGENITLSIHAKRDHIVFDFGTTWYTFNVVSGVETWLGKKKIV